MQTISVTLRAIGNLALQVEVYAKTKLVKEVLELDIEEALGCNTKEGPDFNGGYPFYLLSKTAEVLEINHPNSNWYITYWDTKSQPWEMRYNRPEKIAGVPRKNAG
jgi:hypothetical protein